MNEIAINPVELRAQAQALRLHGLLAHWTQIMADADAATQVAQCVFRAMADTIFTRSRAGIPGDGGQPFQAMAGSSPADRGQRSILMAGS